MNPGNKKSNGRNLRGLFGFIPHVFIIILLLLVMRCEPFSVALNDDQEPQTFVSGEESFKRGGFWRRAWNTITLEATPTPDRGVWTVTEEGVELVTEDDATQAPDRGVWTITEEGVKLVTEDVATPTPDRGVWTITKAGVELVPATATPFPTPKPTSTPVPTAEIVKLPSPDPSPTATSTPVPTALPTSVPTPVKNVSVGGGGASLPTATPESAIEGPGNLTTPEEVSLELNFDIMVESFSGTNYRPEIDFGDGAGFVPVEIIEKEDGSLSVEAITKYSDLGEYQGQLRLVSKSNGEVITVENFAVKVVPVLTVAAPSIMSFTGIIKADMKKPIVDVDFYPFKAISVVSSEVDDVLYAEVDWGVGKGFVSGIVHSNTGQFIGSYGYSDSGIYDVTIRFTSELGGLEERVIKVEVSYGADVGVVLPTTTPTPGPTATPIPGATATPTPAPTSTPIPAGTFLLKWGSQGSGDGQFWSTAIALDSSGNIYVADSGNDRVQKFDSSGNFLLAWGTDGSGDGQFRSPYGIAVDASDNVYVTDTANGNVQKFDSSGNFLLKVAGVSDPNGVAFDSSGNVYVSEGSNSNDITKFDSSGNFLLEWGGIGTGDGQFKGIKGVAVDGSGNVYAIEGGGSGYCRLQKFDSSGNFLLKWGSCGSGDGQFKNPRGIAVDGSGNVYVVDSNNHRVQKFDSSGNFLLKWGTEGQEDGQLKYPHGIAFDGSGNVYLTNDNRVHKFTSGE